MDTTTVLLLAFGLMAGALGGVTHEHGDHDQNRTHGTHGAHGNAGAAGISRFSANFSKVIAANANHGTISSPLSVAMVLRWLAEGSNSETRQEILTALSADESTTTFTSLLDDVKNNEDITFKTANKIYTSQGRELDPKFLSTTRDLFQAEVEKVNFADPETTSKAISDWVTSQTNGAIRDIVSPDDVTSDTESILVNAIYFEGLWDTRFKIQLTATRSFHVKQNEELKVQTMEDNKLVSYHEDSNLAAKMISLPYRGGHASLVVILPDEIEGLAALSLALSTGDGLGKALAAVRAARHTDVHVRLPRFKTSTQIDLKEILPKIGVSKIFHGGLTGILANGKELKISRAVQKAYIKVDERGTEAAAATVMYGVPMSMVYLVPTSKQFHADHPFFYALVCHDVVLFTGTYSGSDSD